MLFCSDEHVTFVPHVGVAEVGDRVQVVPAHIDPTMALHERGVAGARHRGPRPLADRPARLVIAASGHHRNGTVRFRP